ncbi:MAG TPA: HPP family protein, partial [Gemmatimonadaceae bacterium]|nr:HPP family protein [Gemmatimonadaceae bacterium]
RSMWRGPSPAASPDAVWVPAMSAILILAAGAMSLATKQPWLFAGLGPTAVIVASSPTHPTTRVHNVVIGHLTALACAWLVLLLLGAGDSASLFGGHSIPVVRVWASALAVALTALVQPSLRAYHPPAAATALLITLGVHRVTWKVSLSMMAGVLLVALLGEWFRRLRVKEQPGRGGDA